MIGEGWIVSCEGMIGEGCMKGVIGEGCSVSWESVILMHIK